MAAYDPAKDEALKTLMVRFGEEYVVTPVGADHFDITNGVTHFTVSRDAVCAVSNALGVDGACDIIRRRLDQGEQG